MKKIAAPVIILILAVSAQAQTPAQTQAQVKLNVKGYFSFEAVRGDAGLPEMSWNLTNLWGGLIFSGELSEGLTFALEPTFGPGGGLGLTEAWAGLRLAEGVGIKAGLFLVPFGKYNLSRRPHETTLVRDPYPIGSAFPAGWRELGIAGQASFGVFNLAAFAGNGLAEAGDFASGQQFADNNGNKSWGGRLGLALSSQMEIGASHYRGKADRDNTRWLTMWGADASWLSQSIRAVGEYTRAEIENPSPYSKGRAEGWFALLEIRWGRFIPAASFQDRRVDDPFHGPNFAGPAVPGGGIDLEGRRWAFGLAYMLGANVLLKIEYDREREEGRSAWTSAVRAQAAVHF
ncbi:MAG: hypothetical protein JW843_03480 [Candidatus Aminicenantes bacterium]|nr:hypothetical protein [Candidatus Aminicenantes bacterium]